MHPFAAYPSLRYPCAIAGLALLVSTGPFMGLTMGVYILWFILIDGAKEEAIIFHPQSKLSVYTSRFFAKLVRYANDVMVVNIILVEGVLLPILFFLILYVTTHCQLSTATHIVMWYLYSFVRLGPASQHFAYVHTLAHKEGHTKAGMFSFKSVILDNAFNWWIGLFYGLMPPTYAYGHSINHHSYNNHHGDLLSTAWAPRDNPINWLAYLVQFTLYHTNISCVAKFHLEPRCQRYVNRVLLGMAWYWGFIALIYFISDFNSKFVFWYLLYPMAEAIVFLAGVNWSWHLFIDPNDKENEFVSSLTLLNGPGNVLHEDYHVVHHMYPAHHWSKHPALYQKHIGEYRANCASVFQGTHAMELFFLGVTRQYRAIAERYDKSFLPKHFTVENIENLIRERIQSTIY